MFDDSIKAVKKWFRQKEEQGLLRNFKVPPPTAEDLGFSAKAGTNSSIILKEDTHLELGHPSVGSVNAVLSTLDSSLVRNGLISLVGPDIAETDATVLPFAQIAIARCKQHIEETPFSMDCKLHRSAQTDGYMIRSVPSLIWARVSKSAVRSGFSLFELGTRLIKSLWQEGGNISSAELLFVTSNRADVADLEEILKDAKTKLQKLNVFSRTDDGEYECTADLDCEECPEEEVCNNIRDVIKIRKGDRIISFGKEEKT